MARIRTIKPEFFDDEEIAQLSFPARLVFIGLWQQADRDGRLKDRPVRLKARILPFDDVDMVALLDELAQHRFIRRYLVGGEALIVIRSFTKHQQLNVREAVSVLPPPPDEGEHVHAPAEAVHALGGKEGKGKEGNGKGDSIAPHSDATPANAVMVFRTVGNVPTWALTESQLATWQSAYPALDVGQECRSAFTWLEANPSRRKTAQGMPRFVVNWLNRATARGRGPQGPVSSRRPGWAT